MRDKLGLWTAHEAALRLGNRAETTIRRRREVLDRLSRDVDLADVTAGHVLAYIGRQGLSPATRRVYRAHLVVFYRWCVDNELLERDPARKTERVTVHQGLPRPIPPGDLSRALATASPRVRAWLLLGVFAGLRCGEAGSLTGENVQLDLDPPMLRIVGKGGRHAAVPLHPVLVAELAKWPREGYLFPGRSGGHVRAPAVSKAVNRHLRSLGITSTAHSTRHRFGTDVYRASGRDLRMAQELLRHVSPATTGIYTKVDPGESVNVVARLAYDLGEATP